MANTTEQTEEPNFGLEGTFLISMGRTGAAGIFDHALILVCSHGSDGAMGLIVNNEFSSPTLADLMREFKIHTTVDLSGIGVFCGGPVERSRGFILHSADYRCEGTVSVTGGIRLTVAQKILNDVAEGRGPKNFLTIMGYTGWAADQLESELERNMWIVAPSEAGIVFARHTAGKFDQALESIGLQSAFLIREGGNA